MKILVTGANGQLGHDVSDRLKCLGIEYKGVDIADFDIGDAGQTENAIMSYSPDAVMHLAAYTAVDRAEDDRDACMRANVLGTQNVSSVCKREAIPMMYISTDYVFGGGGDRPFETNDSPAPRNVYGLTKYQGELAVSELEKSFIVRVSWVFGLNGGNFVRTMLRLGREKGEVRVVNDQTGSPTYTYDLSVLLCDMIRTEKYGVYHATNEGFCTWYEFARHIFRRADMKVNVMPVSTEEYPVRAVRPKNSRLSKASLDEAGFQRLPHWTDAVERFLGELERLKEIR